MTRPWQSAALLVAAGVCEIGGGYLMWLWLRNGRGLVFGALGGALLVLYGVLPTLQPTGIEFGRVYAAYGGVFIVLSLLWGWSIDGRRPDAASVVGATICVIGAAIIMYWRRPT